MKNGILIILAFLLSTSAATAQIGGTTTFKSLVLPASPRASSVGGSALGIYDDDINTALDNPAFIQEGINSQVSFSNNFYISGIQYGSLAYSQSFERAGNFLYAIRYVSYGEMQGRDEAGNITGNFRAGDYVFSAGYGNKFKERWLYGANVKVIYSHLESYNSVGLALDLSGAYHHEEKNITISAVIKNVGFQFKGYTDEQKEPLPLEVSVGFSKRFQNIPVRLSIIVHNLQKPGNAFESTLASSVNIFGEEESNEAGIVDKIFRHFIFGAEIDIAKPFSLRLGYNHQIRQELALPGKKGFSGITLGAGIHIKQFSIDYSFAKYHAATNIHHLGLTVNINEFTGKKRKGESEED